MRVLVWTGSLALALCWLSGCGSITSSTISAIPRNSTDAYFVVEHAGLAQAAAERHLSIYWNGPSGNDDVEQQISLVDRAIAQRRYGIVLTPAAPFALDTVIERALSKKIPVVIVGASIDLPVDARLSFVLNDYRASGELAAQRVHQTLGDRGEVAIAGDDPLSPGSAECAASFEAALRRDAPGILIDRAAVSYTPGQAETTLQRAILEHPHLGFIYALNPGMTHGALAAIRDSHAETRVRLIGNDQALDLLFLLRQGAIDSLLVQDMRAMGEEAVSNIANLHSGRTVSTVVYHPPMLITLDNIDTEAVQNRLKMDWRPTS